MSIHIIGTGKFAPPQVVTNDDLVARGVDTSNEWIVTRTGIRERRIAETGMATSHMASAASLRALKDAGLEPADVDMIFVATCTPDMLFPSTACLVQEQIGAVNAFALDFNAVCSGFVYGIDLVRRYLSDQPGKAALLIGAEKTSSIINWDDRSTCVLFGDGAGAAVIRNDSSRGRGLIDAQLGSDGRLNELLYIPGGGSRDPEGSKHIHMAGPEVFRHAVTNMSQAIEALCNRNGIDGGDLALVVPHQANFRIISAIQEKLRMPEEKVYVNVNRYGNTSAASVILALDEASRGGRLSPGDLVLMVAFGGGFTWGAALMEWSHTGQPDPAQENDADLTSFFARYPFGQNGVDPEAERTDAQAAISDREED